ncbi:MAG TPA: hypothetical protein VGL04_04660 [Sporichthyaceae bacterium]|jgi:hypothetical protein
MPDRRRDLTEPEGVNSGSARDLLDGADADVRPGGHPDQVEDAKRAEPSVVQPPWDRHDPDAPSLEQSREEGAR